jgi:hypothetical protein
MRTCSMGEECTFYFHYLCEELLSIGFVKYRVDTSYIIPCHGKNSDAFGGWSL